MGLGVGRLPIERRPYLNINHGWMTWLRLQGEVVIVGVDEVRTGQHGGVDGNALATGEGALRMWKFVGCLG